MTDNIIKITPPNTRVFFTADTHFGSKRTLQLSRRPFKSVKQMDDYIISKWNKGVGENDIVFHLGDFGDGKYVQYLNGGIFLLYGNYERENDSSIREYEDFFTYDGGIITKDSQLIKVGDQILNLCHEPSKMSVQYFNLFGHVHQLSLVKKHKLPNGKIQYGLNVGWDIFYKPIDMTTVDFYRNAIYNHYDDEVFW